ncbi:sulfite exporter TauE/SafE family protein [Fictibacillus sp. FJAT-27399]|uniref:urease accessory protein UreH domain-containing protein n=1 Tax=Fictibacillus sp. FJAT-27399 TaxID=1729689 RepID=UPI0007840CFD|nr:sulfite exporter TauE/SafE family protein [Fictibacillus sp. FJAT-27399]SFD38748.1 Cytochrome C biogenesis protein transmembrane region [Bacillus sp. OV194]
MEFTTILVMALLLGLKHALDPDHIVAVTTIVSEKKKARFSALVGAWWGVGHMTTILVIGSAIIYFNLLISHSVEKLLEGIVGVMIIYLGVKAFYSLSLGKTHEHAASREKNRWMLRPLIVGLLHGLAGSTGVAYLFLSTIEDKYMGFLYLLVFGVGTLFSMVLATLLIGMPYSWASDHKKLNLLLTRSTGILSVIFGIYYLCEILFLS